MVMSTLTHNTCANICSPQSHIGREGEKQRQHHFSLGLHSDLLCFFSTFFTLKERLGGEKTHRFQLSHFLSWWNPPGWAENMPILSYPPTGWRLTVVHSCLCTHAQTSWWSGRRHDKQQKLSSRLSGTLRMDFRKSEDTDRQRETERLKWKWRRS